MTDFQLSVLERKLATLRAPHRAPLDLEPPEAADGAAREPATIVFGDPIAEGAWAAVGTRLTRAVTEAVAEHRDALFPAPPETEGSAAAAEARIGPYRERSRFFLLERVLPPVTVSETERFGPLAVRVWVTPERRDALELFHLRSGGAVPPPRERPTPPPDPRFERQAGGPGKAEQHYRLRVQPEDEPPRSQDEPGAGGDRLGIQRGNVVIEAGRDAYTRSGDEPEWRTSGMDEDDEQTLRALIEAIAERLWKGNGEP
ncbi:MAG: hypothetical protein ACLF0P_00435 [Thermoanaerobaculia bacterium]